MYFQSLTLIEGLMLFSVFTDWAISFISSSVINLYDKLFEFNKSATCLYGSVDFLLSVTNLALTFGFCLSFSSKLNSTFVCIPFFLSKFRAFSNTIVFLSSSTSTFFKSSTIVLSFTIFTKSSAASVLKSILLDNFIISTFFSKSFWLSLSSISFRTILSWRFSFSNSL